jgi:hypothetical protein
MYVSRNVEVHSCNHCCSGKAISIAYSEYVFVALGIQRAMSMRHIVVCGLSGSTIFFPHELIYGMNSEKKFVEHKMCILIFSTALVRKISHSKENSTKYCHKYLLVFA